MHAVMIISFADSGLHPQRAHPELSRAERCVRDLRSVQLSDRSDSWIWCADRCMDLTRVHRSGLSMLLVYSPLCRVHIAMDNSLLIARICVVPLA